MTMSDQFTIETPAYQGALETLLDLVEERKMSISDISLADVADAYIAYVEKLPGLPLGETAQFILVASTLLLIKSRALLPSLDLSDEERESVEELERRLARYAIFRKAAKILRKEWGRSPLIFPKRAPERKPIFSPAEVSPEKIFTAIARILNTLPKPETMARAAVAPILALEDVIVRLKERLRSAFKARFSELTQNTDRDGRIVYFLAMLELVRNGSASVTQERMFADITIEIEIENALSAPRYGT